MYPSQPEKQTKILLLENIHPEAEAKLLKAGYLVETLTSSLSEDELKIKLKSFNVLGIRSATQISEQVILENSHLSAIGCFCIGTNQVDTIAAQKCGIPVFNAPFSNSRSVAELIIAQIINLARQLGDRNLEMHSGIWKKQSQDCHEIRGKVLGIVGYGHIGSQLSVIAESLGMQVIYYDIAKKMPHGNAQYMPNLEALLMRADFVSLHVPLSKDTENMITAKEIYKMKYGSYLLNASRGNVVNIGDVIDYLKRGHLKGAYFDVYPDEPGSNGSIPANSNIHELRMLPNVILTPHIGGSTQEAQRAIADEVTDRLISYLTEGDTIDAVNFPQVKPPSRHLNTHRILNIHMNVPGVLRDLNTKVSAYNVSHQYLSTLDSIGYVLIDVESDLRADVFNSVSNLQHSIKTYLLY